MLELEWPLNEGMLDFGLIKMFIGYRWGIIRGTTEVKPNLSRAFMTRALDKGYLFAYFCNDRMQRKTYMFCVQTIYHKKLCI